MLALYITLVLLFLVCLTLVTAAIADLHGSKPTKKRVDVLEDEFDELRRRISKFIEEVEKE